MRRPMRSALIVFFVLCSSLSSVSAQPAEDRLGKSAADVRLALQDGALLTGTLAPRVGSVPAVASGFGGYDAARSSFMGAAIAEAQLWGPFALRGGAEYSTTRKEMRPTIGGRAQLL